MSAWTCSTCGRRWYVKGSRTGFVKAAAFTHMEVCLARSPLERRKVNRRDEARWRSRPPKAHIHNDHKHPGLYDGEDSEA